MTDLRSREVDIRWKGFVRSQADLEERVSRWTVCDAVPEDIADSLRIVRMLVVDSYYVYDYSLIAFVWGMTILEASLRGCVPTKDGRPDKRNFGPLVDEAAGKRYGLLTGEEAEVLQGTIKLRNNIFHHGYLKPRSAPDSYMPQDIFNMIQAIHDAISDIYARVTGR